MPVSLSSGVCSVTGSCLSTTIVGFTTTPPSPPWASDVSLPVTANWEKPGVFDLK